MRLKPDINTKTGLYLGSEIYGKWWKRYTRDNMLARGNGRYWNDEKTFYFLRYLTRDPISIPFEDIKVFKTGKWHSGKWALGHTVLKIVWNKNGLLLSSGFLAAKNKSDTEILISELKNRIKN